MYDRSSPFLNPASPIPAPSKVDFAERRLRDALLWCELAPGQTVSEHAICQRFGLARAAIRTALARLAGEGLVESLPRRGWQARPVTPVLIADLIKARRLLEPTLAEAQFDRAALSRLSELAAILVALIGRQETCALRAGRNYERELLELLAARANIWVRGWLRQAWDHTARIRHFLEGATAVRFPLADRTALVTALQEGHGETAACQLMDAIAAFEQAAAAALMSLNQRIEVAPQPAGPARAASRSGAGGMAPRMKGRKSEQRGEQQHDKPGEMDRAIAYGAGGRTGRGSGGRRGQGADHD